MNELARSGAVRELSSQRNESVREDDASKLAMILWNRKGLVLLGMAAGVIVAFLYQLRLAPVYQVSAQVMVLRKKVDPGVDVRTAAVDDYVATQLAVIKGDQVLREAAILLQEEVPAQPAESVVDDPRTPGAQQSLATMDPARVVDFLKAGIDVAKDAQSASSNIVKVSFRSESPRDCSLALRSIIRGYKAFLDKMYNLANDAYMTRLDRTISTARRDAASLRDDLRGVEGKVQESLSGGALGQLATLNETLRAQQAGLDRLRSRREDLMDQARVAGLMSRADVGVSAVDDPLVRDASLTVLQEIRLLERKVRVLNRQGLGKDHPDVRDLVDEIRELKSAGAIPSAAGPKRPGVVGEEATFGSRSDALLSHLNDKINELEGKLEETRTSIADIQPKVDEIRQVEGRKAELARKLEKADRDVELHEQIRQQYMMTKDHGGYDAQEITRIPDAGSPVPTRGTLVLLVGLFFGGAAGSGLAWLAEKTDRSFKDPAEVSRTLGMPIIGHIPVLALPEVPDESGPIDVSLVAHHAPKSQEAEAYRGLRTALYFSTQKGGHQVIQVTSPSAGDGKSTLSANLAVSMAQSGRKVLLLDADMRKPRLHKLIRLDSPGPGLAALIQGETTLAEAAKPTGVINMSMVSCGPRPANPAELLTSPRFKEVIEEARKAYDIVLIDSPPLLAVSDPCVVAPRVDGVILTLRLRKNGRPLAERAGEILADLDAKVLGAVINGCDPSGGEGYKGYYGYKYNYYYSYSDYHHYSENEGLQSPAPSSRVLPSLGLRPRKGPGA